MSEPTDETQATEPTPTPPQVEPITPPDAPATTPIANEETIAAVGEPDGNAVDASVDPNLGHAFEDQAQGVGTGPTQTAADTEAPPENAETGGTA